MLNSRIFNPQIHQVYHKPKYSENDSIFVKNESCIFLPFKIQNIDQGLRLKNWIIFWFLFQFFKKLAIGTKNSLKIQEFNI